MDAAKAKGHWFFIFSSTPDLPAALIAGREETWLRYILPGWTYDPELLTPEEMAEYVRAYSAPGAIRGACNDYRAGPADVQQDDADAHVRISCPVLALWGEDFELVGQMWDVRATWPDMASNVSFAPIAQCGHLPHEERPAEANAALLEFLRCWSRPRPSRLVNSIIPNGRDCLCYVRCPARRADRPRTGCETDRPTPILYNFAEGAVSRLIPCVWVPSRAKTRSPLVSGTASRH